MGLEITTPRTKLRGYGWRWGNKKNKFLNVFHNLVYKRRVAKVDIFFGAFVVILNHSFECFFGENI